MVLLDEEKLTKAKTLTTEFFSKLGVGGTVDVSVGEETVNVHLSGEDLGILIGFHGETLDSLQLLLGLILNKQLASEEWLHVSLDVGGWKSDREEAIKKLVEDSVERARDTHEPISLPAMNASQRRFVHLLLQEYPDFESHSENEEPNRHIVITSKK